MNYELAKKLKDAGFKQGGDGGRIHADGCNWKDFPCAQPYTPTLSELIEACVGIGRNFNMSYKIEKGTWRATSYYDKTIQGNGSTPEEAVANLWLALNKK